jgi:rSAM/selenodomain-associated transferase 2
VAATIAKSSVQISIVIPAFNEAALIRNFLAHLRERAPKAEIIVADGQSSDETAELATDLCDRVIKTRPNRAVQMNAGAAVARGDVLWFLHVDAGIPAGALAEIERALQDRQVAGGFFRIRLPRKNPVYRLTDSFAHYAGLALRMRCGDHGIFCRRDAFEKLGGFPDVVLMEDVEFFRKLRRYGRIAVLQKRIVASPRRYEEVGPVRLTLAYGLIAMLYFFYAPARLLQSIYKRTCCRTQSEGACSSKDSCSY